MSSARFRLLALLLLAVDWASDPHHGRSPHSRPIGNQVTLLSPTVSQQRSVAPAGHHPTLLAASFGTGLPRLHAFAPLGLPGGPGAPEASPDTLYRFMSLQR